MALTSYMPTLIAEAADYARNFTTRKKLIEAVNLDVEPVEAVHGQAITINVPSPIAAQNVGSGDFVFSTPDATAVNLNLDIVAEAGVKIPNIQQLYSPIKFRQIYLEPCIQGVLDSLDSAIAVKMLAATPTANGNPVRNVNGTSNTTSVSDFLDARAALAKNKVPVDSGLMTYVTTGKNYHNMLKQSDWKDASKVGDSVAVNRHVTGNLNVAYNTVLEWDGYLDTVASGGPYEPGILFHKYAAALAVRKAPEPAGLEWFDIEVLGIPIRVQLSYFHQSNAWFMSAHTVAGCVVARPDALIFTRALATVPTT